jgi:hypothetical protein
MASWTCEERRLPFMVASWEEMYGVESPFGKESLCVDQHLPQKWMDAFGMTEEDFSLHKYRMRRDGTVVCCWDEEEEEKQKKKKKSRLSAAAATAKTTTVLPEPERYNAMFQRAAKHIKRMRDAEVDTDDPKQRVKLQEYVRCLHAFKARVAQVVVSPSARQALSRTAKILRPGDYALIYQYERQHNYE